MKNIFHIMMLIFLLIIFGCSSYSSDTIPPRQSSTPEFEYVQKDPRIKIIKGEEVIAYPSVAEAVTYISNALEKQYRNEHPRVAIAGFTMMGGKKSRLCIQIEEGLIDKITGSVTIKMEDWNKIRELMDSYKETGFEIKEYFGPDAPDYFVTGKIESYEADELVKIHVRVIDKIRRDYAFRTYCCLDMTRSEIKNAVQEIISSEKSNLILGAGIAALQGNRLIPVHVNTPLKSGQEFRVLVKAREEVYLYIAHVDSLGREYSIFPYYCEHESCKKNEYCKEYEKDIDISNRLSAGKLMQIPRSGFFNMNNKKPGDEYVYIFASRQPEPELEDMLKKLYPICDQSDKRLTQRPPRSQLNDSNSKRKFGYIGAGTGIRDEVTLDVSDLSVTMEIEMFEGFEGNICKVLKLNHVE